VSGLSDSDFEQSDSDDFSIDDTIRAHNLFQAGEDFLSAQLFFRFGDKKNQKLKKLWKGFEKEAKAYEASDEEIEKARQREIEKRFGSKKVHNHVFLSRQDFNILCVQTKDGLTVMVPARILNFDTDPELKKRFIVAELLSNKKDVTLLEGVDPWIPVYPATNSFWRPEPPQWGIFWSIWRMYSR
jgi:hypothetical protein